MMSLKKNGGKRGIIYSKEETVLRASVWSDISYAWRSTEGAVMLIPQIQPLPQKPPVLRDRAVSSTARQTRVEGGTRVQCSEFFIRVNFFSLKEYPSNGEHILWGGGRTWRCHHLMIIPWQCKADFNNGVTDKTRCQYLPSHTVPYALL